MRLEFEHIEYLFFLLALPLLAYSLRIWRSAREKQANALGDQGLFEKISLRKDDYVKPRHWLVILSIGLAIIALANPRYPGKNQTITQEAADIFIVLDISNSMNATDIVPSRLQRTKKFLVDVVESLKTERMGIVLFAGSAYLALPLTNDYLALSEFIQNISTEMAGTQGTAIGEALQKSIEAFTDQKDRSKGIILLSDGEDHDGDALEMAKKAYTDQIIISTIGIGTSQGGFIPDEEGSNAGLKLDENGKPIKSKLNETILVDIAKNSGGNYNNIQNESNALKDLKKMVSKLDKGEYSDFKVKNFVSIYYIPLFFAFILIFWEFLLSQGVRIMVPKSTKNIVS